MYVSIYIVTKNRERENMKETKTEISDYKVALEVIKKKALETKDQETIDAIETVSNEMHKKRAKEIQIRSVSTQSQSSYHFSMSAFREVIVKHKDTLYKDYIESESDTEIVFKDDFKSVLIADLIEAHNEKHK